MEQDNNMLANIISYDTAAEHLQALQGFLQDKKNLEAELDEKLKDHAEKTNALRTELATLRVSHHELGTERDRLLRDKEESAKREEGLFGRFVNYVERQSKRESCGRA